MQGLPVDHSVTKTTALSVWGRRSARLGRQIVNLEVAGSNPVGPAIHRIGFGHSRRSRNR